MPRMIRGTLTGKTFRPLSSRALMYECDTIYAFGPVDYVVSLPSSTRNFGADSASTEAVFDALKNISGPIHGGHVLVRQSISQATDSTI